MTRSLSGMEGRRVERRTGAEEDTGLRRRRDDDAVDRLLSWMEAHDDWAKDQSARLDTRLTSVERRADLLDGSAGNDGGIIGQLAAAVAALEKMESRQERQANVIAEVKSSLAAITSDLRDVKTKTGAEDGQKPVSRSERYAAIVIPVLVAVLPVVGTIAAAYFALKGQLAQVPGR